MMVMAYTSLKCELHILLYMQTSVSGIRVVLFVENRYLEQLVDHVTYQVCIVKVSINSIACSSSFFSQIICFAMCMSLLHKNTIRCIIVLGQKNCPCFSLP
jgi:hypothetical protein